MTTIMLRPLNRPKRNRQMNYEFRFSIDAWGRWQTEAADVHEARRNFTSTSVRDFEFQEIETPIHEIIVSDSQGHVTEVFDEAACAELTPKD